MLNRKHLSIAACTLLVFAACKKDQTADPTDLDYTAASDHAMADDAFTDMQQSADDAVANNGIRGPEDACAPVVTFDTVSVPHTMTIDFGTVNCTAQNGRMRRGQLHITWSGAYRDSGTVKTITPVGYYVNDRHIQGLKTVTNMGHDSNGHIYYNVQADGTVTAADNSWTAEHHATRVRTWIAGSDTPGRQDDVYSITGGGHGINRHGLAYTSSITNALRVAGNCPWIEQGTVEVLPQGKPVRTIDWGNGTCDNTFTVTVNGHTFTVTVG